MWILSKVNHSLSDRNYKSMVLIGGLLLAFKLTEILCEDTSRFASFSIEKEHSIHVEKTKVSELEFSSEDHNIGKEKNVSHYYWSITANLTTPSNPVEIMISDGGNNGRKVIVLPTCYWYRKNETAVLSLTYWRDYFCHDGYPNDNKTLRMILNTRSDATAIVNLTVSIVSQESTEWKEVEGPNGNLLLSTVKNISMSQPVLVELFSSVISRFSLDENLLIKIDQPDAERCFKATIQSRECSKSFDNCKWRFERMKLRQSMRKKSVFIVDPVESDVLSTGLQVYLKPVLYDGNFEDGQYTCSRATTETNVTVTITSNSSTNDYLYGILFIIGIFSSLFILTVTVSLLVVFVYKGESRQAATFAEVESEYTKSIKLPDTGVEVEMEHVEKNNNKIRVADLSKKQGDPSKSNEVYQMSALFWPLIIEIGIFYAIPAFQLVSFEGPYHTKRNQDDCYFNFLCLKPVGKLTAFNSFISNISFVCYGVLFISLVNFKERKLSKMIRKLDNFDIEKFGVSHELGIYYGMGFACVMEGVMSSCYHICPNQFYFQFDTTFMYLMGILITVKLYQNRHPDISLTAIKTGALLGIILVCEAVSYYEPSFYFWVIFCIICFIIIVLVGLKTFTLGTLEYNPQYLWRLGQLLILEVRESLKGPKKINAVTVRLVFVAILVVYYFVHLFFIFYDLIENRSKFYASSHILILVMTHAIIYTLFYLLMKVLNKETFTWACKIYFVISIVLFIISSYYFLQSPKKQGSSASISRGYNQDCLLFNFYDSHDLWHFLSASGIFTTFMFFLNLDEDLRYTHRNVIPVF